MSGANSNKDQDLQDPWSTKSYEENSFPSNEELTNSTNDESLTKFNQDEPSNDQNLNPDNSSQLSPIDQNLNPDKSSQLSPIDQNLNLDSRTAANRPDNNTSRQSNDLQKNINTPIISTPRDTSKIKIRSARAKNYSFVKLITNTKFVLQLAGIVLSLLILRTLIAIL